MIIVSTLVLLELNEIVHISIGRVLHKQKFFNNYYYHHIAIDLVISFIMVGTLSLLPLYLGRKSGRDLFNFSKFPNLIYLTVEATSISDPHIWFICPGFSTTVWHRLLYDL